MQEAALRTLPDIVVATPGRMIDHLRNTMSVHLDELAVLILDEADRLLELGFSAEIQELVHFHFSFSFSFGRNKMSSRSTEFSTLLFNSQSVFFDIMVPFQAPLS